MLPDATPGSPNSLLIKQQQPARVGLCQTTARLPQERFRCVNILSRRCPGRLISLASSSRNLLSPRLVLGVVLGLR